MRRTHLLFLSLALIPLLNLTGCSGLPAGTVTASNVTVSVSPGTMTLGTFLTQQFTATVTGSTNTAVVWEVNGLIGGAVTTGTISTSGLYSAPHYVSSSIIPANGAPTTVTITAISSANSAATGSATITLVPQQ
jgi:hypothetical protein